MYQEYSTAKVASDWMALTMKYGWRKTFHLILNNKTDGAASEKE